MAGIKSGWVFAIWAGAGYKFSVYIILACAIGETQVEDKDLQELIKKLRSLRQEWKTVDAKRELILQENGDKAEFVKDVVAMANNGELSYLVIGLEDKTFRPIGALSHRHTKNDLNQLLADKIDPPLVVGYQEFTSSEGDYAIIEILGRNPPYIVARDLTHNKQDRKQVRIYKGTIFVRHEDRTEGISRSELEVFFQGGLRRAFEGESDLALQLVLNQPDFWEYLLTAELLQLKMAQITRAYADLNKGLLYKGIVRMSGADFLNWASTRGNDLGSLINLLKATITEEMPASWRAQSESGDPLEIKRAVEKIVSACNELVQWEIDLRSVVPPDAFVPLKQMMEGWTSQPIKQIEKLATKLREPFEQPNPKEEYAVEIVFEAPPNVDEAIAEIERLKNHPEEWLA